MRLKELNIFSKKNELNAVITEEGKLTLFALFLPILMETLLKNLMNTVSVFIMSRISDDAVASIGVASQILTMFVQFYTVIGIGATVVINQNLGAGRKKRASDTATAAVYLSFMIGVVVGIVITIFAQPIIRLMQLEERLIPDAVLYLRITVGLSMFQAVMSSAMAISRAYGNTIYPVIVSLLMNVLNAAGSYVVVFRPFEIPLSGISGMALVRIFSELIACLVMLFLLKKVFPKFDFRNIRCFSLSIVRDILHIGIPNGIMTISYSTSQTVSTAILAVLGATAISAKIYVTNIVFYSYLVSSALGQANALMVGRLVGLKEYNKAYRMTMRNLFVTLIVNVIFATSLAAMRFSLLEIFTKDKKILTIGAGIMIIDIFVEIGRGINNTFENALVAAGEARFPMIISVCSTWGISIVFSYILGVKMGLGLNGCWIAFAMDEILRGIIQMTRWKSGVWKNKSLVKDE